MNILLSSDTLDAIDELIATLEHNENQCYVAIEIAYQLREEVASVLAAVDG